MLASLDWTAFGTMGAFLVVLFGTLAGALAWANRHVVKPLKIVTGEPETDDDPGKPSLYKLTKDAKETGEKALELAAQAASDAAYVRTQVAPSNGRRTAEIVEDQGKKIDVLVTDVTKLKAAAGIE